jgi:hypothetical protein
MNADATIVESSTTPEVPVVEAVEPEAAESAPVEQEPVPFEEFTQSQRTEWLNTGEVPQRTKGAESSTADAPKGEADTATDPAPVKPKTEHRIKELLRERHELRTKLEEATKAKAQPEAAKPDAAAPVKPNAADFEVWDLYEAAIDKYTEDMADFKANKKFAEKETTSKQQNEEQAIADSWNQREAKFKESNPDFDVEVAAAEISSHPNGSTMAAVIVRDPNGPAIANYLIENPEVLGRIGNANPLDVVRELTRISLTFEAKPTVAPSKPISKSGPPARDLTGNATPTDPIKAAIANGDTKAYIKLMNAKEGRK